MCRCPQLLISKGSQIIKEKHFSIVCITIVCFKIILYYPSKSLETDRKKYINPQRSDHFS